MTLDVFRLNVCDGPTKLPGFVPMVWDPRRAAKMTKPHHRYFRLPSIVHQSSFIVLRPFPTPHSPVRTLLRPFLSSRLPNKNAGSVSPRLACPEPAEGAPRRLNQSTVSCRLSSVFHPFISRFSPFSRFPKTVNHGQMRQPIFRSPTSAFSIPHSPISIPHSPFCNARSCLPGFLIKMPAQCLRASHVLSLPKERLGG